MIVDQLREPQAENGYSRILSPKGRRLAHSALVRRSRQQGLSARELGGRPCASDTSGLVAQRFGVIPACRLATRMKGSHRSNACAPCEKPIDHQSGRQSIERFSSGHGGSGFNMLHAFPASRCLTADLRARIESSIERSSIAPNEPHPTNTKVPHRRPTSRTRKEAEAYPRRPAPKTASVPTNGRTNCS